MLGRSRFHVPSVPGAGKPADALAAGGSVDSAKAEKKERPRAYYVQPEHNPADGRRIAVEGGVRRVTDGVTALHAQGRLDDAQRAAAARWRDDYLLAVEGYADPTAATGGASDAHTRQLARARAAGALRSVRDALGAPAEVWLRMLVVDCLTWAAISERARIPGDRANATRAAQERTIMLLALLADAYQRLDTACDKGRLSKVRRHGSAAERKDRAG